MRTSLAFILTLASAANCDPAPQGQPRFLDQSARRDVESADVVVLGRVMSLSDTAPLPRPAGLRPIRADVVIERVLKGRVASERICIVYLAPYGGYHGPGAAWVESGQTGIFTLIAGGTCLRAVNDRRVIIPAYGRPPDPGDPLALYMVKATLPSRGGCEQGVSQVSAEISSVSIPLLGSRAVWRLMEEEMKTSDSSERACACILMSQVWKVNFKCMDTVPRSEIDESTLEATKDANGLLLKREREWLKLDPPGWLDVMIDGWGLDGTLLRLTQLISVRAIEVTKSTCVGFAVGARSQQIAAKLASAKTRFGESVENRARADWDRWLELGCPATTEGIKELRLRSDGMVLQ